MKLSLKHQHIIIIRTSDCDWFWYFMYLPESYAVIPQNICFAKPLYHQVVSDARLSNTSQTCPLIKYFLGYFSNSYYSGTVWIQANSVFIHPFSRVRLNTCTILLEIIIEQIILKHIVLVTGKSVGLAPSWQLQELFPYLIHVVLTYSNYCNLLFFLNRFLFNSMLALTRLYSCRFLVIFIQDIYQFSALYRFKFLWSHSSPGTFWEFCLLYYNCTPTILDCNFFFFLNAEWLT